MVRTCHRSRHLECHPRNAGFTLIELMVTIAVLAVVMAIAIPSMRGLINSNRLTTQANELVATLQYARSEAVRGNGRVTVCPTADGTTCGGSDWGFVIVMRNRDDAVLRELHGRTGSLMSADVDEVVFSPDGLARDTNGLLAAANINVCIDTTQPTDNQRVVSLASGSRVSVGRASGACP